MSNFSKLNGYFVKDAKARNDLLAEISNRVNSDTNLSQRINNLDNNISNLNTNINTNLNSEISNRINSDNHLQSQINGLSSGSPLVATSSSDMVDTSRIYVLTTDGHWYYYDGSEWADGGTYQSTGLAKDSISLYQLNQDIKNTIGKEKIIDIDANMGVHYRISDGVAVANDTAATYFSVVIPVVAGEIYKITADERSTQTYGYIFVNNLSDMNVISSGMQGTGTNATLQDTVIVPVNATYMLSSALGELGDTLNIKRIETDDFSKINSIFKLLNFEDIETSDTSGSFYEILDGVATENTTVPTYYSSITNVSEGEIYKIKLGINSIKTHGYMLVDDEFNIIDYGMSYDPATQVTVLEDVITIPHGVTKMINNYRDATYSLELKRGVKVISANTLAGKTISVIGDSISTKENKNAYEIEITADDVGVELSAYVTYYDVQSSLSIAGHTFTNAEIGTEVTFTPTSDDIGKKIGKAKNYNESSTKVWWELLEENLNCKINNVSWSGASITSHEGDENEYKTSYSWHESQIRKVGIRVPGSMTRNDPDMIIIYRGVNDFSHTPYTILDDSDFDLYNYEYPDTDLENENYNYISGLSILVGKLRETYPSSEIVICTLNVFKRVNYSNFPTNNGINSLPQYNDAIRKVCNFMGCKCVELDKDGITFENCYSSGYITDSATIPTHPNSKGHAMIYKQVIKDLN